MVFNKRILLLISCLLVQVALIAQSAAATPPAANGGIMRTEGKIYVAMTVAVTILAGLIIFVARLDRKISRLEKNA